MGTPVTNFPKVTVSTGYTNADTTIVLTTGHGSRLPSTFPFPLVWWNDTDFPDPCDDPNREIVIVTNRSGDTLTVTRAGESTTATSKNTGGKTYRMIEAITKGMWDGLGDLSLSETFRGLRIQNANDSDKRNSRVNFSADAIVMDDGTEIQSWVNIAVDITASGANGLDTGTEGASRAYELYAIYNPSTQTKAGLLHRAKDYNLDEDVSAGEDGSIALRDATARTKIANGFQIDIAGPCEFVDVKLVKTGSPTGNYWFTIEGNSGGSPSGTPLATSDKYDASLLSSTATWVRIAFRTPASLSASTQYHLVMQADYAVSGSNFLSWRADTTAATYARGAKEIFDGVSTWTQDSNVDLTFKIYMTENDIAVTMPSGYTQKALICPFIYNDSGSNFLAFMQRDRSIFCFAQAPFSTSAQNKWSIFAAGSGPTAVTLYNLSALVPPRPCVVHVRWGNTTVVTTMNMGHIIGVFVNNTPGPGVPPGSYNPSSSADGHALADLGPLLIEYQGLYALGGSANSFAMINRIDW